MRDGLPGLLMVDTITLSVPAVDVLGEQLDLDVRQYPFEIPRLGESPEERDRVVRGVHQELAAAGLGGSGRPEPEVEDALYLLSSSEISVAAAGLLDVRSGHRLAARVVATGEVGVVGLIDARGLRMSFMSPDDVAGMCADLLPNAPAGAGEPVRADAARRDSEEFRALGAITARPKFRIGHYLVSSARRRGGAHQPGLTWFDNDLGRYTMRAEPTAGGDLLVCGPADKQRIAGQVGELLDGARTA